MQPVYEETDTLSDSHLGTTMDACLTLDTIQEGKEGSSISGESEEHLENICQSNQYIDKIDAAQTLKEEKKIKVQWTNDEDDEEEEENEESPSSGEIKKHFTEPDVDQGWAWVVLIANFSLFTISSGLLACTGLYYVQMLKEFGQSRSYTAWMGSLMNAFYMLAGPLCSFVIKKTSCRTSVLIGATLMTSGYLLSSRATSLPFIFFSYGVVIATGMNFVYSGQIISLAQYFHKYHSLATSAAMVGYGVGMFSMIRLIDYVINEYGWRVSFMVCSAITAHMCIFGALIFPFKEKPNEIAPPDDDLKKTFSQTSMAPSVSHSGRLAMNKKYILNRSVSSLRLSIGAGYLSSSFLNLNGDEKSAYDVVSSNQHSFCSRGSQYFSGIRSNQHSFSQFTNGDVPVGHLPFLRSNQHSFCSRGSSYGIHSLRSNPYSFSNRNSQIDLPHTSYHPCLPSLKDMPNERDPEKVNLNSENKCDESKVDNEVETSKCDLLIKKLHIALKGVVNNLNLDLLADPSFWLLNISMFFAMLATIKLIVIYKDFSENLGVEDYYSIAMSTLGIGDILGRVSGGVLSSYECTNSVFLYALATIMCGIVIAFHSIATWGPMFPVVTGLFGFFYGQQNVLVTIVPSVLFGKEMLVTVFGYILFFAGLGALAGTPLAGYIVDRTGSYTGVTILSFTCCLIGTICTMGCYFIQKRRSKMERINISI